MLPLSNQASHLRGDWHRHSSELLLNPIVMSELSKPRGKYDSTPPEPCLTKRRLKEFASEGRTRSGLRVQTFSLAVVSVQSTGQSPCTGGE